MALVPFKLLPQHWSSEQVSSNKSVHELFKRNCPVLQKFLSSTASITTGFYSQKFWGLLFLALEPWLEGLMWGWDPLVL